MRGNYMLLLLLAILVITCHSDRAEPSQPVGPLFTEMKPERTQVRFNNRLPEDKYRNILRYQYYYNGGGVAIGDINDDGLSDLAFSGNVVAPRLYLNKGNFQFEDISERSGLVLPGKASWSTGISMVDINADGHLDIYLCRSGNLQPENRKNLLFINDGAGNFMERGEEFGLADPGYSIQAAYFDYDKDGDLDLFIANHGMNFYGRDQAPQNPKRDRFSGDKLYRNEGGKFVDVTQESGIYERSYGYGLGVGVGDLNQDGWDDIYVSNDFYEHDYLYWNQGDGTFREDVKSATRQISYFGMGNDIADINNDTLLDIIVLDMTAEDHFRRHTNLAGLTYEKYCDFVDRGYHYQYMFNSLNVNNGNGTFSNLAQLAGIARTDWSWAPLVADFDNDGLKDLYITNGLRKDVLNLDFINNTTARFARNVGADGRLPDQQFKALLDEIPVEAISNVAFRNQGRLQMQNTTQSWGLRKPSFSNGAAYGDLDNDGDLDLVVNNIDASPFLFKNNGENSSENNYLRIKLTGTYDNLSALGSKVYVETAEAVQYQQYFLSRGYQSSMEPVLHFGLGKANSANLKIVWPDGQVTYLSKVEANQVISVNYSQAQKKPEAKPKRDLSTLFSDITDEIALDHWHRENDFDDFKREFLLPYRLSTLGPKLSVGDVNDDGLEDFYIGGSAGFAGRLYIQSPNGVFRQTEGPWRQDAASEDMGSCFFDADKDGDLDLYVASGGNEFEPDDARLLDRLYVNDGKGSFSKQDYLPIIRTSTSVVKASDLDDDGDLDLFVGGRQIPGKYPQPASSHILRNDAGKFVDVTPQLLPGLQDIGMVTDALWTDFDTDGQIDLIVTGEWMPILFFKNEGGRFVDVTPKTMSSDLTGSYFSLAEGDFDGDGDLDYLAGNLGLNHRYRASESHPFEVFAADFDDNSKLDIVLGYYYDDQLYPLYGRNVLQEQLNFLKGKYPLFRDYARATIQDIFDREKLQQALHYRVTNFASLYLENSGDGTFDAQVLPVEAQISPVQAFTVDDFDRDGHLDILLAGNRYTTEYRTSRSDASIGLMLKGDGQGGFKPIAHSESGIYVSGDVRSMVPIRIGGNNSVLVAKNKGKLQVLVR